MARGTRQKTQHGHLVRGLRTKPVVRQRVYYGKRINEVKYKRGTIHRSYKFTKIDKLLRSKEVIRRYEKEFKAVRGKYGYMTAEFSGHKGQRRYYNFPIMGKTDYRTMADMLELLTRQYGLRNRKFFRMYFTTIQYPKMPHINLGPYVSS